MIPAIGGIKVDKKAPTIAIATPAAGTPTFSLSQVVPSAYSCSDGGAGVAQCSGPIASGAPLDTTVGSHMFTVHAVDAVGNTIEFGHP